MRPNSNSRRQIDPASLALFLIGAVCAGLSYWLVTASRGFGCPEVS